MEANFRDIQHYLSDNSDIDSEVLRESDNDNENDNANINNDDNVNVTDNDAVNDNNHNENGTDNNEDDEDNENDTTATIDDREYASDDDSVANRLRDRQTLHLPIKYRNDFVLNDSENRGERTDIVIDKATTQSSSSDEYHSATEATPVASRTRTKTSDAHPSQEVVEKTPVRKNSNSSLVTVMYGLIPENMVNESAHVEPLPTRTTNDIPQTIACRENHRPGSYKILKNLTRPQFEEVAACFNIELKSKDSAMLTEIDKYIRRCQPNWPVNAKNQLIFKQNLSIKQATALKTLNKDDLKRLIENFRLPTTAHWKKSTKTMIKQISRDMKMLFPSAPMDEDGIIILTPEMFVTE